MDAQWAQLLKPLSYEVVPYRTANPSNRKLILNLQLSCSYCIKSSATVETSQWQCCFLLRPQMQI